MKTFERLSDNLLLNLTAVTEVRLNNEKKTAEAFVWNQPLSMTAEESQKLYQIMTRGGGWVE